MNTNGMDAVIEINISSWNEFFDFVKNLHCKRGFCWRGQRKDESHWPLISSFDREMNNKYKTYNRDERLKRHLDNFRKKMENSNPGVLTSDDDETWALAQHYGLYTPLLDWTNSPFIAAYFAFKKPICKKGDDYRYIYALNRSIKLLLSKDQKHGIRERSVTFIDKLRYPSPRFKAQDSVLVKPYLGKDIAEYVKRTADKRPGEPYVVKIIIPTSVRNKFLKELKSMNIDFAHLLLDLHDIVNECNNNL